MIVYDADSSDHVLAGEGGADIVIGIGVGAWAALLHPLECLLDLVVPVLVLVLAPLSVWERRNWETFLVPVSATAAVGWSIFLVAAWNSNASIEVPVGLALVRSWELLLAVEWSTKARNKTTHLISRPVAKTSTAGLLEEISVARVETQAASIAAAISLGVTVTSTCSNPIVFIIGWVEIPVARSNMSFGVLSSWGSADIRRATANISRSEGDWQVDAIDNFDVIEI